MAYTVSYTYDTSNVIISLTQFQCFNIPIYIYVLSAKRNYMCTHTFTFDQFTYFQNKSVRTFDTKMFVRYSSNFCKDCILIWTFGKQICVELSSMWHVIFRSILLLMKCWKNCARLKSTTLIESKWPDICAQYIPVYMYSICELWTPPPP